MKELTLNEKVKDVVRSVVLDDDYRKLQDAAKDIEEALSKTKEYKETLEKLNALRLEAYRNNREYQILQRAALFSVLIAAPRLVRGCKIPEQYAKNVDISALSEKGIYNTDARIASLICKINASFEAPKIKVPERIPYTITEIRKFVEMIHLGLLERENVRMQIKTGKPKRR